VTHRVVVTGMGVISPVGQDVVRFFDGLAMARSGIRPVPESDYSGPSNLVAGQVDFDPALSGSGPRAALLDRATQFALSAAREALLDAALDVGDDDNRCAGVYWGTGLGGAGSIEDTYRQLYAGDGRVRPASVVLSMSNAAAGQISIANRLRGPVLNVSTACSSSSAAIGEACRAIRHGYADVIVAGGSEALVTNGVLRAWDAMRALAHADPSDPSRSCKPFSANRTGIVLGEGAGAFVLESAEHAARRGADVHAELSGYGNVSDASHISRPDADGQVRAMHTALDDAGLHPRDIGYLNAHGTATEVGDAVETDAIRRVFGDAARGLAVSSTKALHGHLMGAAGAVELVAAIVAMERGVIPPTAHLERADPACDLDYVPNVARRARLDAVMSNSFGFGGVNGVLIARRFPA
jgi:3-oxoacyl-[acyl-carrier-protein] synthase II